ncbi:hypothetical protein PROFUN_03092 [Planoprotostelium fungivorum]|uniref:Protein kinase domain-containing protein n=1 Tax=Planoprotostelium fungivorum TaxID=1890364 RepID=A0A2P6NQ80_9EUKA|nr:hypothetical protein PROFUN_03092 [Planoprotostelium fungivorum]
MFTNAGGGTTPKSGPALDSTILHCQNNQSRYTLSSACSVLSELSLSSECPHRQGLYNTGPMKPLNRLSILLCVLGFFVLGDVHAASIGEVDPPTSSTQAPSPTLPKPYPNSTLFRHFWLSAGGKDALWKGDNVCNSTDFVGVTCRQNGGILGVIVDPSSLDPSKSNRTIDPIVSQLFLGSPSSTIVMDGCGMRGTIPSTIWNITTLRNLSLSHNSLEGSVPTPPSSVPSLLALALDGNALSGSLTFLYQMPSLKSLNVSHNNLSDSLPDVSKILNGTDASLWSSVDFSHNHIYGTIPSSYYFLNKSIVFDLDDNDLTSLEAVPSVYTHRSSPFYSNSANCTIRNNPIPCNISERFYFCNYTCVDTRPVSVVIRSLYNRSISVLDAEVIMETHSASAGDQLPSLLSALTSSILRGNTSSFSIRSNDISLLAHTFSASSVYNASTFSLRVNDDVSASVPSSIIIGDVTVVVSIIPQNPYVTDNTYVVGGGVVGVSLYNEAEELDVSNLSHPINISMGSSPPNQTCLYWAEVEREWKREGCQTLYVSDRVTCQCDHLTNFSLGSTPSIPQQRQVTSPSNNETKTIYIIVGASVGVAIKKCIDETTKRDLIREATVMKGMHHPNIVQYLGQDLMGREVYYVMEWIDVNVDGSMCATYLTIAMALTYLSESRLVHTRLTPDKVLCRKEGNEFFVKLCGFSHCIVDGTKTILRDIGLHTAPEVLLSDGLQTVTSNVYSFGMLVYRLGYGADPLAARSQKEMVKAIQSGEVKLDMEHGWAEHLQSIVSRCTRALVEERPPFSRICRELEAKSRLKRSDSFVNQSREDVDSYSVLNMLEGQNSGAPPGLEPGPPAPKAGILPLNYGASLSRGR